MPGAYDSQASEKHRWSAGRRATDICTIYEWAAHRALASGPTLEPAATRLLPRGTLLSMSAIRARVHNGRLQLDQPTELPEGTVLDLVVDDAGDDLDDLDRAALNESISRARASMEAGRTRPMRDLLADLQRR